MQSYNLKTYIAISLRNVISLQNKPSLAVGAALLFAID